jgi:ferritin-like protein
MSSESYHEPYELLSPRTRDLHRAVITLIEELEAVDWYQQRADGCTDDALRAVILHNKNEEVEHAMMTLEWLRRNTPEFETTIRTYLSTTGPITEIEKEAEAKGGAGAHAGAGPTSLGIGSLKGG